MAKAALNMMTRTAGIHYQTSGIFMTSVDTGWITDEKPILRRDNRFVPPLDEIDGAMRCLDPIYEGINNGIYYHTVFLKDYKPSPW